MAAVVTPELDAGFVARDFRLKSTDGGYYGLDSFQGSSAFLVMFICNHCPYVKAVIKHLVRDVRSLAEDFGVGAVAIMPNDTHAYPEDSYDKMAKLAQDLAFPFPYVIDEDQSVAKSYGAVCTPDFFCFNKDMKLCYRGRFDDPNRDWELDPNGRSELFEAVRFVAETGKAPGGQVPSIGCSIKWRPG
ncbi:thioredoxin family protein [Anaplasma capra]|uniref:thioredoxin family protein n=1 Tax=Anaplasma capra TaxID=1562740 RepID=UPI0021D5A1EC|nr:thioredoxin family protein [Anaplasma capra]MCU7611226.1 thioredoxin family protein [Anaplasma capra]MCU7612598.1 thioredoxin family protein [Anaplasma capra]